MDALVPGLLEARSRLETWFAERARCLQIQCKLPRKQRAALVKVLAGDPLSSHRVHADGMACLVADLCGEDRFYDAKAGLISPVDMFFGRSLLQGAAADDMADPSKKTGALARSGPEVSSMGPQEFRIITGFQAAGRNFFAAVRELPHESAKTRLGRSEKQYEHMWAKALAALSN